MPSPVEPITEIILLGGQRYGVHGDVEEVERLILNAARGSIMQLAWLIDAQTEEPLGVNPEYVMTLRAVRPAGDSAAPPD